MLTSFTPDGGCIVDPSPRSGAITDWRPSRRPRRWRGRDADRSYRRFRGHEGSCVDTIGTASGVDTGRAIAVV